MARILVVDDRPENRDLLAYLLRYYGHDVSVGPDGAAALHTALADPPDLVIMDIAMPVMDGCSAARLIRSRRELADLPLIAVSATGTITPETATASGFDAFYPLPIDPADFMIQLEPFFARGDSAD